eukprot:2403902-Pleurochrysis_carterae.AAC.2
MRDGASRRRCRCGAASRCPREMKRAAKRPSRWRQTARFARRRESGTHLASRLRAKGSRRRVGAKAGARVGAKAARLARSRRLVARNERCMAQTSAAAWVSERGSPARWRAACAWANPWAYALASARVWACACEWSFAAARGSAAALVRLCVGTRSWQAARAGAWVRVGMHVRVRVRVRLC